MLKESYYYIWSVEHNAWWRSDHCGYTKELDNAGLYDIDEARKIVHNANRYLEKGVNEVMIPESCLT